MHTRRYMVHARISVLAIAVLCAVSSEVRAAETVACTVKGIMKYEPSDYYYCDSDHLNGTGGTRDCSEWNVVDLDRKRSATGSATPLQFMRIEVRNASESLLGFTHTESDGSYSVTFPLPVGSCNGQIVKVRRVMQRVHEEDIASKTPRYRFRVVYSGTFASYVTEYALSLAGASTTSNKTYTAASTSAYAHAYAVYFTVNSAITEAVRWSPALEAALASPLAAGQLKVVVDQSFTGGSYYGWSTDQKLWINYDSYLDGFSTRHEFGHRIHHLIHGSKQTLACYDDSLNGFPVHMFDSCEYGFTSTLEALANLFAIRSATGADTNVWGCFMNSGSAAAWQDDCSRLVAARVKGTASGDSNADGVTDQTGANDLIWFIAGDMYANSALRCVVPDRTQGCSCAATGTSACTTQNVKNALGFRNEVNITRFFWDMLDANNESGLDDTNISISDIVRLMEAMPSGNGVDGSCNEPNTSPCTNSGRDKYNVYDFAWVIPGNQADERPLNCVSGAVD